MLCIFINFEINMCKKTKIVIFDNKSKIFIIGILIIIILALITLFFIFIKLYDKKDATDYIDIINAVFSK